MNGVLVVDKPAGPSSHDVIMRLRRASGVGRIGHTGTLDPMATGVLPIVFGRATRLAQFLSASDKSYDADIRLGVATDSYDVTGRPAELSRPSAGAAVDRTAIDRALESFRGTFLQHPPPFSAKKIAGVRAYALARRRLPVQPPAASVTVSALEVTALSPGLLRLRLTCSAGFYVRSLAHDLGQRLGTGGCLEGLRRIRSGQFGVDASTTLERFEQTPSLISERLVPVERLLTALPGIVLTESGARRAAHGNDVRRQDAAADTLFPEGDRQVRLLDPNGFLVAIGETGTEPGTLHPAVVLV